MEQYEKAYPCFSFIGPAPIDYYKRDSRGNCVWGTILCDATIKQFIQQKKKKIGIIFNTDVHTGPGIHWVSLFMNLSSKDIIYFDSAGGKIPSEIERLVTRWTDEGKTLTPPITFKFHENHPYVHQKENTECGVYSLFVLIHLLEDRLRISYLRGKGGVFGDSYMSRYRSIFWHE